MQQAPSHQLYVESQIPDDWFPEHATLAIVARQIESDLWEAVIPQFGIAGQGADDRAAAQNSLELLDDYLTLVRNDGKSFEEAVRPVGFAEWARIYGEMASATVVARIQHRSARRQLFRFPLSRAIGLVAH
jgi:hypothetical protein